VKKYIVTFYETTGDQREPWLPVADFPVQATSRFDAVEKGLFVLRHAAAQVEWSRIDVREVRIPS
jgi:hypothetical protein